MNPFDRENWKVNEYFCNRPTEYRRFVNSIDRGRNLAITGLGGIGKSSFVKNSFLRQSGSWKSIFCDLSDTLDLKQFVIKLGNSVLFSIEKDLEAVQNRLNRFSRNVNAETKLNKFTGNYEIEFYFRGTHDMLKALEQIFIYLRDQPGKVVIAFDEFPRILSYPDKNTATLLRYQISILRNTSFVFIGSSSPDMDKIFFTSGAPFYQSADLLNIGTLPENDYLEYITKNFFRSGIEIPNDVILEILDLTESHTFFTQKLLRTLFHSGERNIDKSNFRAIFRNLLSVNENHYRAIESLLTPVQWKILIAIAKEKRATEPNSKDFTGRYGLGAASSVNTGLKSLATKNLIIRGKSYVRLYDVLFAAWLRERFMLG
jgi:hypothetical protein